jgi:hypothetical protein
VSKNSEHPVAQELLQSCACACACSSKLTDAVLSKAAQKSIYHEIMAVITKLWLHVVVN